MQLHLEILRPRLSKNLWVIYGDLIGNGSRIDVTETFDYVQSVAVIRHGPRAAVIVSAGFVTGKWPFFQADRVDHQGVPVPLSNGVSHPRQFQISGMQTAIRWNHAN